MGSNELGEGGLEDMPMIVDDLWEEMGEGGDGDGGMMGKR